MLAIERVWSVVREAVRKRRGRAQREADEDAARAENDGYSLGRTDPHETAVRRRRTRRTETGRGR